MNMTDLMYGRLLIREEQGRKVLAECVCGSVKWYERSNVLAGYTQSCGCLRDERIREANSTHSLSSTRTYNIWQMMKARCTNPTRDNYKYYGGRGITYCDEWEQFVNFVQDMGEAPPDKELDRVDGNYCPENCRWATRSENIRNRGY